MFVEHRSTSLKDAYSNIYKRESLVKQTQDDKNGAYIKKGAPGALPRAFLDSIGASPLQNDMSPWSHLWR